MTSRIMIVYGDGRIEIQDVMSNSDRIFLTVCHISPYASSPLRWCLTFGDLILHVMGDDERPTTLDAFTEWAKHENVHAVYIDGARVFQFQ